MREWSEATARKLCIVAGAGAAVCLAVIAGRVAAFKELWKPPDLGPWATIALWVLLAVGLLFGMDRGIPREGPWSRRLYWMRRGLVLVVFATIGVMVYLK